MVSTKIWNSTSVFNIDNNKQWFLKPFKKVVTLNKILTEIKYNKIY